MFEDRRLNNFRRTSAAKTTMWYTSILYIIIWNSSSRCIESHQCTSSIISHDCITKANLLLQPECWLHLATTSNCVPWAGKPYRIGKGLLLELAPSGSPKSHSSRNGAVGSLISNHKPAIPLIRERSSCTSQRMKGGELDFFKPLWLMCEDIRETSGFREISGGMAQRYERTPR